MSNPDSHITSFTASQSSKGRLFSWARLPYLAKSEPPVPDSSLIFELVPTPTLPPADLFNLKSIYHLVTLAVTGKILENARHFQNSYALRPLLQCISVTAFKEAQAYHAQTHLVIVGNCNSISLGPQTFHA